MKRMLLLSEQAEPEKLNILWYFFSFILTTTKKKKWDREYVCLQYCYKVVLSCGTVFMLYSDSVFAVLEEIGDVNI